MRIAMILAYLGAIVGINYGFANTVPWFTPWGVLPKMTFFVGAVFVLRDYLQRVTGDFKVLPVMLAGCLLSYWLAGPTVAVASFTAFAVSEFADWTVFTKIPGLFHRRVLLSSIVGVPVDSLVFLPMINQFSWPAIVLMSASKMVAAIAVYFYYEVKCSTITA